MFNELFNNFISNLKQFFAIHPVYFTIIIISATVLFFAVVLYFVVQSSDFPTVSLRDERIYIQNVLQEQHAELFVNNIEVVTESKVNGVEITDKKRVNRKKTDNSNYHPKQALDTKEVGEFSDKNQESVLSVKAENNNKGKKRVEGRNMAKKVIEEPKKTRVVNGKYEIFYDGKEYFYTLKASNGELLVTSEHYTTKETVLSAIEAVKRNVEVGTISIAEDKRGLFQFYLTAKNHRTLIMSANYPTEKRALAASESFKRFAASSPVVEEIQEVESTREEIVINTTNKKGGKIGILKEDGGYVYVLKASNGELLVHSDVYRTYDSAENALTNFREAIKSGKFYVVRDKRDYFQFKLYSSTGRIVEVGETYQSKQQAISSANSVCSFVEMATIIEE